MNGQSCQFPRYLQKVENFTVCEKNILAIAVVAQVELSVVRVCVDNTFEGNDF